MEPSNSDVTKLPSIDVSLELALRAGRLGTWQWEIKEDRLAWSQQLCDLFGYNADQVIPTCDGFLAIMHPEDRKWMKASIAKLHIGNCPDWELEFRVIRGDTGEVIWTYGRGMIERNDRGVPQRITAVASDITQRKHWEHELADREADLRSVIDNVIFFIGVLEIDGTLREANATAMHAGGVQRNEVIGKKFWDCYWWNFDTETMQYLRNSVEQAAAGQTIRCDVECRLAGDVRVTIDFGIRPVRDQHDQVMHLIASGVDISDRIKAEKAALRRERHLSLAQDVGRLGSWVWDIGTGQITWSDQLHQMYGYDKDQFAGTPEGFLAIVVPEDRKIVQAVLDSVNHSDSETEEFECRSVRGTDGRVIWSQVRWAVDRDTNGRPTWIAGFAVDITERKQRELSLAFFSDLQLAIANLKSAADIARVASHRVANFLQLSHCLLIAIDEEAAVADVFCDEHSPQVGSLCGLYRMADFVTQQERKLLQSGRALVIDDTAAASRQESSRAKFAALQVGSIVDAPCLQDQRLRFLLTATKSSAYQWQQTEIELLQELATRIYLWLERARVDEALLESERTLRESEEQLQLGIDVANFSIGRIDYRRGTIHLPAKTAQLYGLAEHDITVTRDELHAVFHPDDRRELDGLIHDCIESASDGRISMEHRVIWPSGEVRWLNISKQIVFDASVSPSKPIYGILAAQDITERKKSELAIRINEERLRIAAEAAGFGMLHVDLVLETITYSEEFRRMLGVTDTSEMPFAANDAPNWVHPEDADVFVEQFAKLRQMPEGSTRSFDHRVVLRGGETRWVRLQGKPLYFGTGARRIATQVIVTLLDITPQRRFEESLEEARAQAEAANDAKSAFLANMSHEIRTPMTAILGYTDLIAEDIHDPETLRHVRTIRKNGDFLLEIINDILDLSKIESGKLDISALRFSPSELVEDVRSIMHVRASEKQLDLDVEYCGTVPLEIMSDPKRLKQILINLVGNAIKFTPSGHVKVIVTYQGGKVPALQFQVVDSGIGMSAEQMKRLFRPFSQGDGNVNREFGGTGLGLAISQRLSELLGGSIDVQSELGKGSTFTATISTGQLGDIALIQPDIHYLNEQDLPGSEVSLNCHILVVDDRRDIRFLSKTLLTRTGATVSEAEDGEIAVQLVEQKLGSGTAYDLILLDMQMPRLDGYQTAKALRRLGYSGPIIALTADAMQGDMKRCIECGCNDYLSKPIDKSTMLAMVARYVSATGR